MKPKFRRRKKHRLQIHRRTGPGTSPGTIAVDPQARPPDVQLIAFGPDQFVERDIPRLENIHEYRGKYPVVWINVDGLGDAATVRGLGEMFGLHDLALEDVVNTHQRAKVEIYDEMLFIVARMADLTFRAETEQLSMFVSETLVLTFQEAPGDCWTPVRERIRNNAGRIRSLGTDYLAYALLDASIDAFFPVLEHIGERLDALEDEVLSRTSAGTIDWIHEVKGDLLLLRRAVWPHREALAELARESTPLITERTRIYLRDCYDHVVQLMDLLETYRELAADLRDVYMSAVNNRINETMRVLTIISTIFIPLTFIAGIYGMNFDPDSSPLNMPELRWHWGYPFSLGLMAATTIGMFVFFWFRGWLGGRQEATPTEDAAGTEEQKNARSASVPNARS